MNRRNAIKAAIGGIAAACGVKAANARPDFKAFAFSAMSAQKRNDPPLGPFYWNVTWNIEMQPDGSYRCVSRTVTPVPCDAAST